MSKTVPRDALRHVRRLFNSGTLAGMTDAQLLARFRADRDEAAFTALVDRHGPMVLATCRAALRDARDAEDAFQATFLVLARRADSFRVAGETLGGWLHGVALRVAARARADAARRSARELTVAAPPEVAVEDDRARRDELRAAMHLEVGRLPARYRAPVVLCYLEGRTHAQAAAELGRGEATVRRRLAEAKDLLRSRLARRGIVPAAGLAELLRAGRASAALPEALASAAIRAVRCAALGRAAAGGGASVAALALAGGVLRAAALTKLKAAGAAVGTLAAATCLGIAGAGEMRAGAGQVSGATVPIAGLIPAPDRPPAPDDRPDRELEPQGAGRDREGLIRLVGRVVDPSDRPVSGATVQAILYKPVGGIEEARPAATSRLDGRFTIDVPEALADDAVPGPAGRGLTLVASADGFGPGWAWIPDRSDSPGGLSIRVVEDDVPIIGRLVDLEGRPVAGARIRATNLFRPRDGDSLDAWLVAARGRGQGPWQGLEGTPFDRSWTTGPDGRFRIDGIGRERLVELTVTGPAIAAAHLFAMTRDVPAVRAPDPSRDSSSPFVYHGARLDLAAAPGKPIVGVVRDRDTGEPLPSVMIRGRPFEPNNLVPVPGVEAVTDAEGRYELVGLPLAGRYTVFVLPGAGLPYPNAVLVADARTPAYDPEPYDVGLVRGVVIRGRVIDGTTGAPVPAAISYFALRDNPHADDHPGFRAAISFEPRAEAARDGSFEVVGLPGRGLLAARSASTRYPRGDGADAIEGLDPVNGTFDTAPGTCYAQFYHRIVPVEIEPGSEAVARDVRFRRGGALSISAVDPDGEPLDDVHYEILTDRRFLDRGEVESGPLVVEGLEPGHRRHLILRHPGRGLAGSLVLGGEERGAITATLGPWGVISGRIVDEDGRPRRGLHLRISGGAFDPGRGFSTDEFQADADGRFRIEGLVPGLRYDIDAAHEVPMPLGTVFKDVEVGPGELKDLGEISITPDG